MKLAWSMAMSHNHSKIVLSHEEFKKHTSFIGAYIL